MIIISVSIKSGVYVKSCVLLTCSTAALTALLLETHPFSSSSSSPSSSSSSSSSSIEDDDEEEEEGEGC
jgi:hypothetical protein